MGTNHVTFRYAIPSKWRKKRRVAFIFCVVCLLYLGIFLNGSFTKYYLPSQRFHEVSSISRPAMQEDDLLTTVKNSTEHVDLIQTQNGIEREDTKLIQKDIEHTDFLQIQNDIEQADFMQIQNEIQKNRINHIRRTCEALHVSTSQKGPLDMATQRHIYVNHKIRGIYCFIPKVACSNWKRVMMVLNGYPKKVEDITGPEAHERNGLTLLSSLTYHQQNNVLANYTKFMVVREPFLRLISAYKNKFEQNFDRSTNSVFQGYAKMIMSKYRRNPTRVDIKTGRGVRWDEFVSYLTDPGQRAKFESHWQEMHKLCSTCKVNYNYIVKLETIKDDSEFILRSFNASNEVKFPAANVQNSRPSNSSSKYLEYYNMLSPTQIKKLWSVYKTDFDLFDYPKPHFVN